MNTVGNLLEVRDYGWRHAGRKAPALQEVSFSVAPGERILLLGASGAGKSTLLRAIAGVLGDGEDGESTGEILINGIDARATRGIVGMVMQDPDSQVIASRVGDDVVFGCENLGVPREEMWERAEAALDTVGLRVSLDWPTDRLSGGQKQRLALAGVLAMRPRLMLLDEPTANLDPQGAADVLQATQRIWERTGAAMIVVEHQLGRWMDQVDRLLVLDGTGKVVADGDPLEVLARHGDVLEEMGLWLPGQDSGLEPLSAEQEVRPNPVLELSALRTGWRGHSISPPLQAVAPQGSTVLVGANGVGKTTLALTAAGLLPPVAGEVRLFDRHGNAVPGHPHRWKSTALVQRIGYVFQDPEHQFMTKTVEGELLLGPRLVGHDAQNAQHRATRLLGQLGLLPLAQANPFTLSGGQKRRLSVASALMTDPMLLMLDEPTFGQDRANFVAMARLLQDVIVRGGSLLSITHDAEFARVLGQQRWDLQADGLHVSSQVGGA